MEEKNQFHFESKDLFFGLYGDNSIEEVVFNLTKVFDDNIFILMKSIDYYKEAYNLYLEDGVKDWFKNSIDVIYHLNMMIRMVTTVDDIIIKLTANTFILIVDNDEWVPKNTVGKSTEFYKKHINDSKYPEIPSASNRYTRTLRNDVTHDGDIILQRGWVTRSEELEPGKKVDMKVMLGPEGFYDHNLKRFDEIYKKIERDVEKILEERDKLENLLINKLPIDPNTH